MADITLFKATAYAHIETAGFCRTMNIDDGAVKHSYLAVFTILKYFFGFSLGKDPEDVNNYSSIAQLVEHMNVPAFNRHTPTLTELESRYNGHPVPSPTLGSIREVVQYAKEFVYLVDGVSEFQERFVTYITRGDEFETLGTRSLLSGLTAPTLFDEDVQQIESNTYCGDAICYLDRYTTKEHIRAAIPPAYMRRLIFPLLGDCTRGLRFNKAGVLEECDITEHNAIRVAFDVAPIMCVDVYGEKVGKIVRMVAMNLDKPSRDREQFLCTIVREFGVGWTYEELLGYVQAYLRKSCKRKLAIGGELLIATRDCRNTILRFDGSKLYWFDDNWVWTGGSVIEAISSGVTKIWQAGTTRNISCDLYRDSNIGNPVVPVTRATALNFDRDSWSTDDRETANLNIQLLSEMREGETVHDFFKKVPSARSAARIIHNYVFQGFVPVYRKCSEYAPLGPVSVKLERSADVAGIVKVTVSRPVFWVHRDTAIKYIQDNKEQLISEFLSYVEEKWGALKGVLPIEFYKTVRLSYLENKARIGLVLEVPGKVLDAISDMSDAIREEKQMSRMELL